MHPRPRADTTTPSAPSFRCCILVLSSTCRFVLHGIGRLATPHARSQFRKRTPRERLGFDDDHDPTHPTARRERDRDAAVSGPAFLFDLDGTLVDSVYQHVLAWREALEGAGIELSVWRIHRRIGMSGGLFLDALLREIGRQVTAEDATRIQRTHAASVAPQE